MFSKDSRNLERTIGYKFLEIEKKELPHFDKKAFSIFKDLLDLFYTEIENLKVFEKKSDDEAVEFIVRYIVRKL